MTLDRDNCGIFLLLRLLLRSFYNLKRNLYNKCTTDIFLTLNGNVTTHQLYDLLRDNQSQTGTAVFSGIGTVYLTEPDKQLTLVRI